MLLLSGITDFAQAAVKAGAACSKLNVTSVQSGYRYTCIKSGKKLVWSKAAKIALIPTPTASATVESIKPVTMDNLDPKRVTALAIKSVMDTYRNKQSSQLDIRFFVDPSVSSSWIDSEKQRLNRIHTLLSDEFAPKSINALYWIDTNEATIKWGQDQYDSWGSIVKHNLHDDVGHPVCGNAWGSSWLTNTNGALSDGWGFVTCAGEVTPDKAFKAAHEYFHLFQTNYHVTGQHQVQWIVEGSADYYGVLMGLYYENPQYLNTHRQMLTNSIPGLSTITKAEFITRMQNLEAVSYDNRQAYYFGSLATEVLVAVYGHQKVIDFLMDWKDLPDCRRGCDLVPNNLNARFDKAFGISTNTFYEKLYPYVKAMSLEYKK